MPGVSDPGFRLASLAIRHKIPVVPIPGASAFLSALVASGLPTDSFVFHGYLPSKLGQRRKFLEGIQHSTRTQIFYEAPHRLLGALEDVVEVMGAHRRVVVAREVTKIYEEFVRTTAAEALEDFKSRDEIRGEITLLLGRAEEQHGLPAVTQKNARTRVRELMKSESLDEKDAMKRVAKEMKISKSDVYRELQKDGKK
jgi:16S rRNA (cytidine1402-2'-O)-methyltransferase